MPDDFVAPSEVPAPTPQVLLDKVNAKYSDVLSRQNVEDPFTKAIDVNYPAVGSLVRPQYTTYAHFMSCRGNRSLETVAVSTSGAASSLSGSCV